MDTTGLSFDDMIHQIEAMPGHTGHSAHGIFDTLAAADVSDAHAVAAAQRAKELIKNGASRDAIAGAIKSYVANRQIGDSHRSAMTRMFDLMGEGEGNLPDYGYGPVTEESRRGLPSSEARSWNPTDGQNAAYRLRSTRGMAGENAAPIVEAAIDRGSPQGRIGMGHIVAGMLTQPHETATAWENALVDPSITNVTDAGVQTAMLAGRPMGALKTLGAGYGVAAAKDMGAGDLLSIGTAEAGKKGKASAPEVARLPGLTDEEQATYAGIMARLAGGDWGSGAERRALESQAKVFQDKAGSAGQEAIRLEAAKKAADQAEYNAAVQKAETVRDDILAQKPKRFNQTEIGKMYDRFGVVTPGVMAAGAGALTRSVGGGIKNELVRDYVAPGASGMLTGALAANWPQAHPVIFEPAENLDKSAYGAYARELPPGHPRKAEWETYARSLPATNEARAAATAELYDPIKLAERLALGAGEGILGGVAGGEVVRLPGQVASGVGNLRAAWNRGQMAGDVAAAERAAAAEARAVQQIKTKIAEDRARQVGAQTAEADALTQGVSPPGVSISPPTGAPVAPPSPPTVIPPPLPPTVPVRNPSGNPLVSNNPLGNVADLSRIGYGADQKNIVRPLITSEVAAGRPVPTMETVNNALMDQRVPMPTIGAFEGKMDQARAIVESMRARGIPDNVISATLGDLMKRGRGGLPVVAAGGAGAGAMAMPGDAEAAPHWARQDRNKDGTWK